MKNDREANKPRHRIGFDTDENGLVNGVTLDGTPLRGVTHVRLEIESPRDPWLVATITAYVEMDPVLAEFVVIPAADDVDIPATDDADLGMHDTRAAT